MPKHKVMIARFPYGGREDDTVADWLVETVLRMKADPRLDPGIMKTKVNDTPVTMSRNLAVEKAKQMGADLLLMIDSDMAPDMYVGVDPNAKPFWPMALEFLLSHAGPAIVAAPYCGPPPHENVFIFRVANFESDTPQYGWKIEQYSREEAAARTGIEKVAALPTGLMLIDMRAFRHCPPPYFAYEHDLPFHTRKETTEDVFFSRNMALVGVPQYVTWDCWAGHWKRKLVGKPCPITIEDVAENLREAIVNRRSDTERLVSVGDSPLPVPVATVPADAAADLEADVAAAQRPIVHAADRDFRPVCGGGATGEDVSRSIDDVTCTMCFVAAKNSTLCVPPRGNGVHSPAGELNRMGGLRPATRERPGVPIPDNLD